MANPALPFGIDPDKYTDLVATYKRNRAKKEFAVNNDGATGTYPPIPKWDQIIKIKPGLPNPEEYLSFVGVDIGVIDIDDLSPETRLGVMRRLLVAEKTRSENVPEWRQKMVTVMTALDNAEDIISTLAWMFGPYIEKTGKIGKGLVKGAKGTSTAINFINKFLRGPELTRKAKHKYMNDRHYSARDRIMRGSGRTRAGKWLTENMGRLFQAAQASESLTGVGIQIGTIYGTLETAFFDDLTSLYLPIELYADKEQLRIGWHTPDAVPKILKRIEENEAKLARQPDPWIVQFYDWAKVNVPRRGYAGPLGRKIQGLIDIIKDNPFYEVESHALALAGFNMWAFMAGDGIRNYFEKMDIEKVSQLYDQPPITWNAISQSIMRGYGIQFDDDNKATGRARHTYTNIMAKAAADGLAFMKNHDAWLPRTNQTDTENFLHCQVISAASLTGGILSTSGVPLSVEKTLDEDLVFFSLDQAAVPPRDASPEAVERWGAFMKSKAGPDRVYWRRGGFARINLDYWRKLGLQPATFNN